MQLRLAQQDDMAFVTDMARLAGTLEDRPLPSADAAAVLAVLPSPDATVVAVGDDGRRLGAAWWHFHDPPLLCDADGEPLPEMVMAVLESERRQGVGTALIDALADEASKRFTALVLNVHLRNRAAHLYTRTGFRVAGAGRGWFGVAMSRPLRGAE